MRRAALAAALLLCACPRRVGPPGSSNLDGLSLPLTASAALRLAVDGALEGRPAEVRFEVAALLSRVTRGCFDGEPTTGDTVRVARPDGQVDVLQEVDVDGLAFGGLRYPLFLAGLEKGDACVVTLGNDQLMPWAMSVDVAHRTVSFSRSRDRGYWAERSVNPPDERRGFESHLLELTRDPSTDWPLLAVRLKQQGAEVVGPFVLSTATGQSQISADAVHGAGLVSGFQLLKGVQVTPGLEVPSELAPFQGIVFDALELAPDVGVHDGALQPMAALPKGREPPALGVLACDVWSHFDAIIDVGAGVLLLQRPRVLTSGDHQRCDRGGALNEEACFELEVRKAQSGLVATGTIWRALPEGGQLHLEFASDKGALAAPCRIGFTFSATDRGGSVQHEFPWHGLERLLPACAQSLASATHVELSLFEDGDLAECPGACGFAQDLRSGNAVCGECQQPVSGAANDSARQFLRMYKQLLEGKKLLPEREQEPDDPP